jgi:hypothetical protein
MLHQFVLDYLEFILAIIVIAQGIILWGQNSLHRWALKTLTYLWVITQALSTSSINHDEQLDKLNKKVNP